ncbi:mfsd5 [Symbiodinium sp. CCMP2592]|nr:mfsd5 [Symbiodinium sp. CCMP2592]
MALEYPIHLGLAYLFLGGYLASRIFWALRLPAAVGIIASGFIFSHFIQFDILQGRDHLQGLSFFLVLLTAGFELQVSDLRAETFVFAFLPVTLELLGIAACAQLLLHFTLLESLVLGATLCCLGDGLVIPKMIEIKSRKEFESSPMPRLVFAAAPLEASYVLTIYGVLEGLAVSEHQEAAGIWTIVFANLLRIAATLLFGSIAGYCAGVFIVEGRNSDAWLGCSWADRAGWKEYSAKIYEAYISWMPIAPKKFFRQTDVEAYLFILSVALLGFGVGSMTVASLAPTIGNLLPSAFGEGEMFQPELLVIVIGSSFAYACEKHETPTPEEGGVLDSVLVIVGGVWTFGQLVLFSMLGSRLDVTVFQQVFHVLPLMVVGQAFRFLGVGLSTILVVKLEWRTCEDEADEVCKKSFQTTEWPDAMFCFLSAMPRATIQGALGPVPLVKKFFPLEPAARGQEVRLFIAAAARLYVLVCAVAGSILLDDYGPWYLEQANSEAGRAKRCKDCHASEVEQARKSMSIAEQNESEDSDGSQMEDLEGGLQPEGTAEDGPKVQPKPRKTRVAFREDGEDSEELPAPKRRVGKAQTAAAGLKEHIGAIQNWTYSSSEARRRTLAESVAIQRRRRSSVSGSRPSDSRASHTSLPRRGVLFSMDAPRPPEDDYEEHDTGAGAGGDITQLHPALLGPRGQRYSPIPHEATSQLSREATPLDGPAAHGAASGRGQEGAGDPISADVLRDAPHQSHGEDATLDGPNSAADVPETRDEQDGEAGQDRTAPKETVPEKPPLSAAGPTSSPQSSEEAPVPASATEARGRAETASSRRSLAECDEFGPDSARRASMPGHPGGSGIGELNTLDQPPVDKPNDEGRDAKERLMEEKELQSGYVSSLIFWALRLPAAVGIIANGFVFSNFIQADVLNGRDDLQALSFFLVLLTAGFELQVSDLRAETFVFAFFPVTLELLGIAACAQLLLHFTLLESLVLGATLCCLGDGLVIPKMIEIKSRKEFENSPMPRLVFTAAPLEASYVLTIYGVLEGLAVSKHQEAAGIWTIVFANLLRIAATLLVGSMIGYGAGLFISKGRKSDSWLGSWAESDGWREFSRQIYEAYGSWSSWLPSYVAPKRLFRQTDVESYLMILSVALLGFGIGSMKVASLVPMFANLLPSAFGDGDMFQPELLVIVIGSSFAYACEIHQVDGETGVLDSVLVIVGGVWTFGQLVLFSMLGSRIDVSVFLQILNVLPLMLVGQACRFLGVWLSTILVVKLGWRTCERADEVCKKSFQATEWPDAMFCFLSAMPRATIQGALGPVPLVKQFFPLEPAARGQEVRLFIAAAARLYVLICAIFGSILLDDYGPFYLEQAKIEASKAKRCSRCHVQEFVAGRSSMFGLADMGASSGQEVVRAGPELACAGLSDDEVLQERSDPGDAAASDDQDATLEQPKMKDPLAGGVEDLGRPDSSEVQGKGTHGTAATEAGSSIDPPDTLPEAPAEIESPRRTDRNRLRLHDQPTQLGPTAIAVGAWNALPSRSSEWPKGFAKFMATYLSAWTLCVAADWLQGPYVYALYEAYGFSPHEIAQLFVAGFGSALFCSCVGPESC